MEQSIRFKEHYDFCIKLSSADVFGVYKKKEKTI